MRGAASPGLAAVLLSSDNKPISSDNDTDCVTGAIEDAAAGVCGEKQQSSKNSELSVKFELMIK